MAKYKITEEQKKEITEKVYRNPHMFYINSDLSNPLYWKMISDNQRIDEGMICTYSPEKTYEFIKDLFDFNNEQIKMINSKTSAAGDTSKKFIVTIEKNYGMEDAVKHAFNLCGYIECQRIEDNEHIKIQFMAKYTGEATNITKFTNNLIHVTPVYNKEKILLYGLSPKLKNNIFVHDGRVYLFPATDNMMNEIIMQMLHFEENLNNKRNDSVWTMFLISLKKTGKTKFYYDPNHPISIYTYDNIPPDCIIKHKDVDLKQFRFKK